MCSLFGFLEYRNQLSGKSKSRIINMLAQRSEIRGTDATGVAYTKNHNLHVFKRSVPARKLVINIPTDCKVVMGHTRLTTKGTAKKNYNNHPFRGLVSGKQFALAHNGIISNDADLRTSRQLPDTKIQTDSFVAVQLVEEYGEISIDSFKHMAELLEGSFTFTVLDEQDNLFIVKGSSPICIYDFYKAGFYIYTSTEEIMEAVLISLGIDNEPHRKVNVENGEILCFDPIGNICRGRFDYRSAYNVYLPWDCYCGGWNSAYDYYDDYVKEYLCELKTVARSQGYSDEQIDELLLAGFSMEEIELFIYEPEYFGGERF